MTFIKTLAVGTFLASTLAATGAFAKAHDQGIDSANRDKETVGVDGRVETAARAQELGAIIGEARGWRRLTPTPPPGDTKHDTMDQDQESK